MPTPDVLHVRVNPDSRRVDITDPGYVDQWVANFNRLRAQQEAALLEQYKRGNLAVTVPPDDPLNDTPERVIHFQAHGMAEEAMQRWAMLGAIGLPGIESGYDHGQVIVYHDDPQVALYGHQVMDAAEVTIS